MPLRNTILEKLVWVQAKFLIMRNPIGRICLGIAFLVYGCSELKADILYDSFGPGLTTDSYFAGGSSPSISVSATPFVSSGTAWLSAVEANLGVNKAALDPGDQYSFAIWSDAGGHPGAILESWSFVPTTEVATNVTFTSATQPLLFSGAQYWALYTSISAVSPTDIWGTHSSAPLGGEWVGIPGVLTQIFSDHPKPALRIEGAVPEPSTLAVSFSALVLIAGYLRARKFVPSKVDLLTIRQCV
jgi:hypothetical protein